jgi:hypothetical protein
MKPIDAARGWDRGKKFCHANGRTIERPGRFALPTSAL